MKKIIATLLVTAAMSSQVSAQPVPVATSVLGLSTTGLIITGTFLVAAIASVNSANNHK